MVFKKNLKECSKNPVFFKNTCVRENVYKLIFYTFFLFADGNSPPPAEPLSDSTVNWDMEYKHVSLVSASVSPKVDKMDISNSSTPHSKIFTSQRKRLSDSFKHEEQRTDVHEESLRQNKKLFKDDALDAGYHTINTFYDESYFSSYVFASTPSKRKN